MLPNSSLIPAQSLEERGLVIKTPVQTQQSNPRSAQKLMTNLMHLKRFAPDVRLGPNQFLKVSAASKWSDKNLYKVITAHGRASLPWLVSPCHHSSCNIFICMQYVYMFPRHVEKVVRIFLARLSQMVENPDGGLHLDPSLATYAVQDENKALQAICDCITQMASGQGAPSVQAMASGQGAPSVQASGQGAPSVQASGQGAPSAQAMVEKEEGNEGPMGQSGAGPPAHTVFPLAMAGDPGEGGSGGPWQDAAMEAGHAGLAPPEESSSSGRNMPPVVIESDLKLRMGFRLVQGHREWRKYKVDTNNMGCLGRAWGSGLFSSTRSKRHP